MENLLEDWGFSDLIPAFKENGMDVPALKRAAQNVENLRALVPRLGDFLKFKACLLKWVDMSEQPVEIPCKPVSDLVQVMQHDAAVKKPEGIPCSPGDCVVKLYAVDQESGLVTDLNENVPKLPDLGKLDLELLMGDEEVVSFGNNSNLDGLDSPETPKPSQPSVISLPSPKLRSLSPPIKKCKNYDWNAVLDACDDGKKCAALTKKLGSQILEDGNTHRSLLASAVIFYELKDDNDANLSRERLEFLAKEVVKHYPNEKLVDWYERYKDQRGKVVTGGRLVHRYYKVRREYTKCGLVAKATTKTLAVSKSDKSGAAAVCDKELQGKLLWLQKNRTQWDSIVEYWSATSEYRVKLRQHPKTLETIKEYMEKYPALLEPKGYELLEIDFKQNCGQASPLALFEEWGTLREFICDVVKKKESNFLADAVYSQAEKILLTLMRISEAFPVESFHVKSTRLET